MSPQPSRKPQPPDLTKLLTDAMSAANPARTSTIETKGNSMFFKLIISAILAAVAGFLSHSTAAAVSVFLGAFFVALLIEGIRIVPQQNAWVIERLGKFHAVA